MFRRFHNWVKSDWLRDAVFSRNGDRGGGGGGGSLLDFGCGFGGDLHKWTQHHIEDVFAVDPSASAIREAKRRHEEYVSNRSGSVRVPKIHWVHDPEPLASIRELPDESVDVVTAHFCLHYYPRAQQVEVLRELLRVLARGGSMHVTFMEGKRVLAHSIRTANQDDPEGVRIRMVSASEIEVEMRLDNAYFVSIGGTSREHLVFATHLVRETSDVVDTDVRVVSFEEMYALPHKPDGLRLNDTEKTVSFLHTALVFRKRSLGGQIDREIPPHRRRGGAR